MPRKMFKSLKVGEHFGLSLYDESTLIRIKQEPAAGPVPFYNAQDTITGQLIYVPAIRYIYSDGRKGRRK